MKLDKFLCFMFLSVFLAFTLQKHTFFREDNQSNPSIKLCATKLQTRAKRKQKIVQGHGRFNIDCNNIVLAFEGSKVSYPVPRLTMVTATGVVPSFYPLPKPPSVFLFDCVTNTTAPVRRAARLGRDPLP